MNNADHKTVLVVAAHTDDEALAKYRGHSVGVNAAEAFMVVRVVR